MNGVKGEKTVKKKRRKRSNYFYIECLGMFDREIKEQIRASLTKSSTGKERLEKARLVHMQRESRRQEV